MAERDPNDPAPEQSPRLQPARIESHAREAYLPRFPWKTVLLAAVVFGAMYGTYWISNKRSADAVREEILRMHDGRLAQVSSEYVDFREKLTGWTARATREDPPTTFVDPRLATSFLQDHEGLFLRVQTGTAFALAAKGAGNDAIARCLGASATSARVVFDGGAFLDPAWIGEARETNNLMKLRVVAHELMRRVVRDLPPTIAAMKRSWFLLILQRGEDRARSPVDVFLWDLRTGERLLAMRAAPDGFLIPVRVDGRSGPAGNSASSGPSVAAADCSIAAQIRDRIRAAIAP